MPYLIVGTVSSVLFIGCLWGLFRQILDVRQRRKRYGNLGIESGYATRSLSANGFASSFFAFYAFLIYAMSLHKIELFVFGTRLAASLATLYIMFEIYRDRASRSDRIPFQVAVVAMILAAVIFMFRDALLPYSSKVSTALTVVATLVMLQGGLSQIRRIFAEGCTGALSSAMVEIFFLKDVSNVLFGLVLGFSDGWPVMLADVYLARQGYELSRPSLEP